MDIFSVSLAVVGGICLGTALIHLLIGVRRPGGDMKPFAFGLFALAYGGAVLTGLLMYRAAALPEYLAADKLSGVFAGLTYIFLIWFVAIYTEVQPLPFLAALTVTFAVLMTAHITRPTLIHGEIFGISMVTLPWGEEIAFLDAAESIWEAVFILAQLATIAFVFYACFRQYRRGERQEALLLGTGMLLFVAAIVFDILVESGLVNFVLASDFGFLPLAIVMSLKLSSDTIRTENELASHRNRLEALVEKRTAELDQSNRTARALLDAPPDSALLIDREGIILDINETAASRLGTKEAAARGASAYELLELDVAEVRKAKVAEAIDSGLPVRWEDVRSGRYIDNRLYPIRDESGQVASIAVYGADITERRMAEAALQRRVVELATLNHVAQALATVTELPSALDQVCATVNELFGARYTHLLLREGDGPGIRVMVGFDSESGPVESSTLETPLQRLPFLEQALSGEQAVVLPDVQSLPPDNPIREFIAGQGVQCVLLAPLLSRGRTLGVLTLALGEDGRSFSEEDVRLAETFAGDLAAAIENTHLAEQAQAAAVSAERSRLARELHDSVTQLLFSINLIALSLGRLWKRDPEMAERSTSELQRLTRGALAEMRTLLRELRPQTIAVTELGTLLSQLGDGLSARHDIPVEVDVGQIHDIPAEVHVTLYRIAQEALNNITKHAEASQVAVKLACDATTVRLAIIDDGQGFDLDSVPAEHMGLDIMRERAAAIGAEILIDSQPGAGATISVGWPLPELEGDTDA